MHLLAYCPHCESRITANTVLGGDDLELAMASSANVEVMHFTGIDHRWKLSNQEKDNLRREIESAK
jgi:hypothetical protein